MYYLILKIMEKNNFIRSIREVMEKTTLALQNGDETFSNLPIVICFTPVENIQTAHQILLDNLEYEQMSIRCLKKTYGPEELPGQIYVMELDSQLLLAVANFGLYVLDRRIYSVSKSRHNWISTLKKVINGKTIACYE